MHGLYAVSVIVCIITLQDCGRAQSDRKNPYDIDDYKSHPCKRTCVEGEPPMTCKYYFLVEHFTTMSAACYNCPNTTSHCSLPQCVTGNGLYRPVLSVNRMVPGPSIHACKGDSIEVEVDNRMEMGEGTTIHWHGIRQKGTPYMDGTSMVTQCPITKWSKMLYRFQTPDAGTFFWHSHAALQRSDGLFGGLVIRQPKQLNPQGRTYDLDLPEHTIILNDWAKSMSVDSIVNMFYRVHAQPHPSGILVNGRGQAEGGAPVPHEEFFVRPSTRYRFRVIYSGILNCPIYVRVDGHKLLMIASDGEDFEPREVDSFTIYSGERYDFVLQTKEREELDTGSYWIRFKGHNVCRVSKTIQAAILRYDVGGFRKPEGQVSYNNTMPMEDELTLSDRSGITSPGNIQIVDLKSLNQDENDPDLVDEPDKKFYIAIARSTLPDERFLSPPNPDCAAQPTTNSPSTILNNTPMEAEATTDNNKKQNESYDLVGDKCQPTKRHNLQLNYITGRLPPAPPLTQYDDVPWKLLCNGDNIRRDCEKEHCECVHTLPFDLGDLVELVMVSPRGGAIKREDSQFIHPMHIHGHSARVVAMMRLENNVSVARVKAMDERGEIPRVRSRAPYKDTIPVGDHSVVVLRFRADNPGFWFFHCHIELHTELGMNLVLQAGQVSEMPRPPDEFPACHTWSPDDEDMVSDHTLGPVVESLTTASETTFALHNNYTGHEIEKVLTNIPKTSSLTSDSATTTLQNLMSFPAVHASEGSGNGTTVPFINSQSVMIIGIAVLVSVVLPAIVIGTLVLLKRRKSKREERAARYRLLAASPVQDGTYYNSVTSVTEGK